MGWLTGWTYRKSHTINPATGAGVNYQKKIVVHYGSGSDSGEDVYLNGKCRTDFGDIRFTDNDEVTELDYWMEEKVDSDYAIFWIEVADSLESSAVTIYIYYGNATATYTDTFTDLQHGENTFPFFDNFGTVDQTKWNFYLGDQGDATSDGNILTLSKDNNENVNMHSDSSFSYPLRLRGRVNLGIHRTYNYFGLHNAVENSYLISMFFGDDAEATLCRDSGSSSFDYGFPTTGTFENVFVKIDIAWKDGSKATFDIDDGSQTKEYAISQVPDDLMNAFAQIYFNSPNVLKLDWVFISKYVEPEPAHGDWGAEEGGEVDPPTVTTQPATGIGFDINGQRMSAFTFVERWNDVFPYGDRPHSQGVCSDGTYIYCTNDTTIKKFTKAKVLVNTKNDANLEGTNMEQINHIFYKDGYLYVGAMNYDTTPRRGYIKVFDASDLSYVTEYQVQNQWCEGCAFYDGKWWVCYYDYAYISAYNSSWVHIADYSTTSTYSQGITAYGEHLYVVAYLGGYVSEVQVYEWTGSALNKIATITEPVTDGSIQGLGKEPNEDIMWFAENDQNGEHNNLIKCSIAYIGGTHATLNGTITDTGGENAVERGFDWDVNSGAPYANSWTESNSYGVGAFNRFVSGLPENQTIYFRAKARNSGGWGYGNELSFKTPKKVGFSDVGGGAEAFGAFQNKSFVETGNGGEAFGIPLKALPFTEVGGGVDAYVNPYRAMAFVEVGEGEDAFVNPYRTMDFVEVGGGADVFTNPYRAMPFADQGYGTDVFSKIVTFVSVNFSDVGEGVDAFEIPYRQMGFVEVAYGMDVFGVFQSKAFVDNGNGAELFATAFRSMAFSDQGLGSEAFGVFQNKGFADSGYGSDVFSKIITFLNVQFSDDSYGSDEFEILHKGFDFVDVGEGSDVFGLAALKFFIDAGNGADVFETLFRSMDFVETGEGTDVFNTSYREMGFLDVGYGTDVFSITYKTLDFIDVGSGSDVFGVFLNQLVFEDTGQAVDVFASTYKEMGFADSGSGADVFSTICLFEFSDTGFGTEVFTVPYRKVAFSDNGLGTEVFEVTALKYFVDAGSGTEVFEKEIYGLIDKFFYETGIGTDVFSIAFKAFSFIDFGYGTDVFETPYKEMKFEEDGLGTDAFVMTVEMEFGDVGSGADLFQKQFIGVLKKYFYDSGHGSDFFVIPLKGHFFSDAGLGSDAFSKIVTFLSVEFADSGIGSDIFSIVFRDVKFLEEGLGADAFQLNRYMGFGDVGQGLDNFAKAIALLSKGFIDSGYGSDAYAIVLKGKTFVEDALGLDSFVNPYREVEFPESGLGQDSFSFALKLIEFSDVALGTDVFKSDGFMWFVDVGHGTDAFSYTLALKSVSFLDVGHGADVFTHLYRGVKFVDVGGGIEAFIIHYTALGFFDVGHGIPGFYTGLPISFRIILFHVPQIQMNFQAIKPIQMNVQVIDQIKMKFKVID